MVMGWEATVACIDVDSLVQYERDARTGRAEALYNLGLAYSTGQGVAQDYVAAHKWFNLAALRGSDEAKSWRNQIAGEMDAVPDRAGAETRARMARYFK